MESARRVMHMLAIEKRIASPVAQNATGLLASGFGHVCGQGCLGFLLCQLIGTLAHLDDVHALSRNVALAEEDFLGLRALEGGVFVLLAEGQVVVLRLATCFNAGLHLVLIFVAKVELVEAIYGVEPGLEAKDAGRFDRHKLRCEVKTQTHSCEWAIKTAT